MGKRHNPEVSAAMSRPAPSVAGMMQCGEIALRSSAARRGAVNIFAGAIAVPRSRMLAGLDTVWFGFRQAIQHKLLGKARGRQEVCEGKIKWPIWPLDREVGQVHRGSRRAG